VRREDLKIQHLGNAGTVMGGRKMKFLGNAAALLVALSIMGGLMLAQRDYQNSWREPSATAFSTAVTNAGTPMGAAEYKVVMK
jgi:hypothetical protein